jgi:uncharacterized membrane protein
MFDTIGGLPVHSLVIHVVVVLIPLSAIGAILIAARPKSLRLFGAATVVGAGLGTAAAFVAKESGESLASRVGLPETHADFGDKLPILALAYFVVLTVFWLYARGVPLNRNRPLWLKVFGAVLILISIGISYFTFMTGDTGTEATWSEVIQQTSLGDGQKEN